MDAIIIVEESCSFETAMPYLINNKPAAFKFDISNWDFCQHFLSGEKLFNYEKFCQLFGHVEIPVDFSETYSSSSRVQMKINEVLQRIQAGDNIYGKDWHFMLAYPDGEDLRRPCTLFDINVPEPFCDDWLNWYWERCRNLDDDYRFIYFGGLGTKTGVHHDVLYSYSWSINICGFKRWTLWPPSDSNTDDESFSCVTPLVYVQPPGIIFFVPSGWHHTVENIQSVTDPYVKRDYLTFSINHNWFNGFNIYFVWRFLVKEFNSVRKEMWCFLKKSPADISDVTLMSLKEWNVHCDLVLRANCSLSMRDFIQLLCSRVMFTIQLESKRTRRPIAGVPPIWVIIFCQEYFENMKLSASDHSLYQRMYNTLLSDQNIYMKNIAQECENIAFVDQYHLTIGRFNQDGLNCSILGSSKIKTSVAGYSIFEIICIFKEILDCPDFIDNLSDLYDSSSALLTNYFQTAIQDSVQCYRSISEVAEIDVA